MKLLADRALRDPEIVELLADDPALLALVDALYCTQRPEKRRPVRGVVLLAATAAVVAAVLGLIAPWQSNAEVVSRALAAVGTRPVVHVTVAQALPEVSTLTVDSGHLTPAASRIDVYFDARRTLERIVSFSPLTGAADELHTATGDWVNGAPILTCAWIAAHPAAAVKARVSCPPGSSTSPQPPTLDRALATFASGYRAALRSGKARQIPDGNLGGRSVHWLAIGPDERVAVDPDTLLPVLVRTRENGHSTSYRVLSFTTKPFVATDFSRAEPPAHPAATSQSVQGSHTIGLAAARRALGGVLVAPVGVDALRLSSAQLVDLVTGYAHEKPSHHSIEVALSYRAGLGSVVVRESTEADPLAHFDNRMTLRRGEALILRESGASSTLDLAPASSPARAIAPWQGFVRIGDLFITVEASSKTLLLRTLHDLKETP